MSTVERWVQLTYTVVDAARGDGYAGSGGGWQVKQASPGLQPDEQELMLRATSSVLAPPNDLPRYPSEAEIAALPVRLRFAADARRGVWCHSAPAGPDATGRPDNVFNHAVIDRELADRAASSGPLRPLRPVQAWRAPGWLRPFGAAATKAARFGAEAPLRGDWLTREAIVEFLLDPDVYRFDGFSLLLDAVAVGRPVVLATRSADEAALWIGALSFFMSPQRCAELSFSTYERAPEVFPGERAKSPAHAVTAVPREDLAVVADRMSMHDRSVLLIDPDDEAVTQTVDQLEHRVTRFDQRVAVTDWSRLAADVCCERAESVVRVLERLDQVSTGLRGDEVPAWPLAAAVAMSQSEFPLAMRTATALTLFAVPQGLKLGASALGSLLVRLSHADVGSVAAAWNRVETLLSAPAPNPAMVQLAVDAYLHRAVADDDWVLQPSGPPLPDAVPGVRFGAADVRRIRSQLQSMLARLAGDPAREPDATRGVRLLHALDFAARVERLVGLMTLNVMPELDSVVAEVARLLLGPAGDTIAARAADVGGDALQRWVAPAVATQVSPVGRPGTRLAAGVTALLGRTCPADHLALAASAKDVETDLVRVEVAVALATGRLGPDRRLRPLAAALCLRWAAGLGAEPGEEPTPLEVQELMESVAGEAPFEVGELLRTIELVGVDCELLLVQPCLNRLADWLDDEDAPELARRLLMIPGKHLFEPVERAGSGPTIQRELLGVVAAGGGNTLLADGGMPIKAGLLLSRVDRLWPRLTPEQRAALAPRVVVWAFQTGIAINLSMYTNVGKGLFRASARHQLSTHWEQAIGPGLHAAVPALTAVLTMESKETADEPLWYWLAVAWVRDFVDQHPEEHHLRRGLKLTLLPVEWVLKHVLQQVSPERAEAMMRRAVAVGISGLPSGEVAHRLALDKLLETVPVPDAGDVSERRSRPFRVGLPGKWKRETGE